MERLLTVQDAAAHLGVSATSLKRLCEKHKLDLPRTPGGHRRLSFAQLSELRTIIFNQTTASSLTKRSMPRREKIIEALCDGRSQEIVMWVLSAIVGRSEIIQCVEERLVPAIWHVGALWHRGEMKIFEEHLCTNTLHAVIDQLQSIADHNISTGVVAVGGCLGDGNDTLASKIVGLGLSCVGIRSYNLGAEVPADALADAAIHFNADIVWCTHTHWKQSSDLLREHERLQTLLPEGTLAILGGGGISPSALRALSWYRHYETVCQMADDLRDKYGSRL